jgi:hypothetical protein
VSAPVRSGVLAVAELPAGGYQTLTTVPAGIVLLVKHVAVYHAPATQGQVRVYGHTGALAGVFIEWLMEPAESRSWEGWFALEPGHTLRWHSDNGPTQIWVSGAILPGVSPIDLPDPGPPASQKPDDEL